MGGKAYPESTDPAGPAFTFYGYMWSQMKIPEEVPLRLLASFDVCFDHSHRFLSLTQSGLAQRTSGLPVSDCSCTHHKRSLSLPQFGFGPGNSRRPPRNGLFAFHQFDFSLCEAGFS